MKLLLSSMLGLWSVFSLVSTVAAAEYTPEINPDEFTTHIDNPYFTLTPGTIFNYKSKTDEGTETQTMIVTNLTREVNGVETLVVWDRAWLDEQLVEETYDWYAQDSAGNVWYFGEESREYENGKVKNTHGSWEYGVDGAQPGKIMLAKPSIGDTYRQEFYAGEAEDMAEVAGLNESVETPYGSFTGCLKTKDTTPLEPQVQEFKYYCPEVGMVVLEDAGDQKNKLVDLQRSTTVSSMTQDWLVAGSAGLLGLLVGLGTAMLGRQTGHQIKRSSVKKGR